MDYEPQTVDELRARYLAVKKRLGGVSGPTGVVPLSRVKLPHKYDANDGSASVFDVNIPTNRFTKMLREVAAFHGLNPDIVKSSRKLPDIVRVKQEVIYRAREELGMPVGQISNLMHLSHSTVIYGYRSHKKRIASDAKHC